MCRNDTCTCEFFDPSGEFDLLDDDFVCHCGHLEREHDADA